MDLLPISGSGHEADVSGLSTAFLGRLVMNKQSSEMCNNLLIASYLESRNLNVGHRSCLTTLGTRVTYQQLGSTGVTETQAVDRTRLSLLKE